MKEYKFKINGNPYEVRIAKVEDGKAEVEVNGSPYTVEIEGDASEAAARPSAAQAAGSVEKPGAAAPSAGSRKIVSPLPGVIVEVCVKEGDSVTAGQKVAVLEAMKMENEIQAEAAGTVTAVHIATGDSVLEGAPIVSIA